MTKPFAHFKRLNDERTQGEEWHYDPQTEFITNIDGDRIVWETNTNESDCELIAGIPQMFALLEKYHLALEFYADKSSYIFPEDVEGFIEDDGPIIKDGGEIARTALLTDEDAGEG